jgi:hypothetical protein
MAVLVLRLLAREGRLLTRALIYWLCDGGVCGLCDCTFADLSADGRLEGQAA